MNIRDLQYFLAAAELEHFGRAAETCHVSQPTLSGQIKKLEASLGVALFERSGRSVLLTDSGRRILVSARRILREVEAIQELARTCRNPLAGRFHLGAIPTLAPYVFPDLVRELRRSLPELELFLVEEKTETLTRQLRSGELDAILVALPIRDDSLQGEVLFEDEFFLAVPPGHELETLPSIRQEGLRPFPLMLLEEGHCLRDQALEICSQYDLDEEQAFRSTGLETLRQMVKAGSGLTLMPRIAIPEGPEGDIRYVPFEAPVPSREIGLFWRRSSSRVLLLERLSELLRDLYQR